ncbi:hypothetical protein KUL113_03150 [Tenacibaculum sp. KUL113]|nr:hypothetical protein KUL113_03150 [Tenacibaculum sp. KUL113]
MLNISVLKVRVNRRLNTAALHSDDKAETWYSLVIVIFIKEREFMKKISSRRSSSSPFSKIMRKGHQKTGYKDRNGALLMCMSENDHKRIAKLIAKWLENGV